MFAHTDTVGLCCRLHPLPLTTSSSSSSSTRSQANTFVLGGYDTTSNALAGAVFGVARCGFWLFLFVCACCCVRLCACVLWCVRRAQNLRAARLMPSLLKENNAHTPTHVTHTKQQQHKQNNNNSNAAAEAALLAEIDALGKPGGLGLSLEDLERLPYTAAVIDEALRLWPPGAAAGRVLVDAGPVGGYELPAGASVMVDIYTMHR